MNPSSLRSSRSLAARHRTRSDRVRAAASDRLRFEYRSSGPPTATDIRNIAAPAAKHAGRALGDPGTEHWPG